MFLLHDIFRHTKGVFTMLTTILVCILAGLGAGLGTGLRRNERRSSHQPDADHISWHGAVSGDRHSACK